MKLINKYGPLTTDVDLYNIAKKQDIQLDAVVFKDELKDLSSNARSIILNLESSQHHGSHWTTLFVVDKDVAIYSDSFAVLPPIEVIQFCQKNKIHWLLYNRIQYQHINQGYCGELSLSFLGLLQSIFK